MNIRVSEFPFGKVYFVPSSKAGGENSFLAEVDARLYIAAPVMLAALEAVVDDYETGPDRHCSDQVYARVKAALAQATGG